MPWDSRGSSFLFRSVGRRISLPGLRNEISTPRIKTPSVRGPDLGHLVWAGLEEMWVTRLRSKRGLQSTQKC